MVKIKVKSHMGNFMKNILCILVFVVIFTGCNVKHISPDSYYNGKIQTPAVEIDDTNQFLTIWTWNVVENGKVDQYRYMEGLGQYKLIVLKDALGIAETTTFNDTRMIEIKRQGGKILSFKIKGITFMNDQEPCR
jgi:hypothetical protein